MPDEENTLLKDASRLLKQNQLEEAARVYQKLGHTYFDTHQYTKALASFQKALEFSPGPEILCSEADVYEHLDYPFSAYECLEHALVLYQKRKEYDPMITLCQKMSHLDPLQYFPHEKLAQIYLDLNKEDPVPLEFQKAAQKAFHQKKHRKAIELLYHAFKFSPQSTNIWITLKNILIDRDPSNPNVARIERELQKLHVYTPSLDHRTREEQLPVDIQKHLEKAMLLLQENLFQDATNEIKIILKDSPSHPDARKMLEDITKQKDDWSGRKTSLPPEDVIRSLSEDFGLNLESPKEPAHVLLSGPGKILSPEAIYDLAIAYMEMGLHLDAIQLLKNSLKQFEKNPAENTLILSCILIMSHCQRKQKQWFDAISTLEKSLYENIVPFDKLPREHKLALLYELGLSYEESGNDEKALSCLRTIEREQRSYRDIVDRIQIIRLRRHE